MSGPGKQSGNDVGRGASAGAHLMWKFCTLTFLYGAVFLWHQRRSPSLAEVSAKHMRTVSTGPKRNAQKPGPGDCTSGSGMRVTQNLGERPSDRAAAAPLPDAAGTC